MAVTRMADLPRLTAMWLLSFAILTANLHGRPDGPKLINTIHRRHGPGPARAAPLQPSDRAEPPCRTDAMARTSLIVSEPGVAHRDATGPSTPDPSHLKHKTSIANAHKLSSDPTADGAPVTDHYQAEVGNERETAASAPSAAPTSPVPVQPAAAAKIASAPPPEARPDPPDRLRPPPRPPGNDPPEYRIVAETKPPRSGEHATAHGLPHSAVAAATACPVRGPPPPPIRAACSARATMDTDLIHRGDRAPGQGPRPPAPPAQALPPADATGFPLHSKPSIPADQHRTAPRAPPPSAIEALLPWLRRPPLQPRSNPARYPGTHNLITQRGGDQDMHREAPAHTAATATTLYDDEPPQDNATRLKRARASAPPVNNDGRARERRTSPPAPGPRAPTPADATALPVDTVPRAPATDRPQEPPAHAVPPLSTTRPAPRLPLGPLRPSDAPNHADPAANGTSMEPRRKPDSRASPAGTEQAPTSELAAWSSSLGSIPGTHRQAAPKDPIAEGVRATAASGCSRNHPDALLSSVPGSPSGGPVAACSAPARGPALDAYGPSGAPSNADYGSPGAITDAHRSGGAATAPKPGGAAPTPADAQRATAHAGPTRARPEAGFVVRVHEESASATVILPHPEQHDLLQVRWNTSMRQTSTINLTDIASMAPPRPKRLRASTTANHADPTADDRTALTVDNRSAPTNASQADHTTDASASPTADDTTAPAACGQVSPDARGRRDPAAADHANATTEGGADPTTDHHGSPGTHGTLVNRAVTTHDNPGSTAGNRKRRHTTVDMTDVASAKEPQRTAPRTDPREPAEPSFQRNPPPSSVAVGAGLSAVAVEGGFSGGWSDVSERSRPWGLPSGSTPVRSFTRADLRLPSHPSNGTFFRAPSPAAPGSLLRAPTSARSSATKDCATT